VIRHETVIEQNIPKEQAAKKFEWLLAVLRRCFFVSLRPGFASHIPRMTLIVQRGIGSGGGLRVSANSNQILIQRPLKGVKMEKRTCHFRAPRCKCRCKCKRPTLHRCSKTPMLLPFSRVQLENWLRLSPHTNACTPDAAADLTPWTGPSSAGAKAGKQGKANNVSLVGRVW
jgi:hypothetical protein